MQNKKLFDSLYSMERDVLFAMDVPYLYLNIYATLHDGPLTLTSWNGDKEVRRPDISGIEDYYNRLQKN